MFRVGPAESDAGKLSSPDAQAVRQMRQGQRFLANANASLFCKTQKIAFDGQQLCSGTASEYPSLQAASLGRCLCCKSAILACPTLDLLLISVAPCCKGGPGKKNDAGQITKFKHVNKQRSHSAERGDYVVYQFRGVCLANPFSCHFIPFSRLAVTKPEQ